MARNHIRLTEAERIFIQDFKTLYDTRGDWQVWADFITWAACAISNAVDMRHYDEREQMYMQTLQAYNRNEVELFPRMLGAVVAALEDEPDQDFLGALYMKLELGNHWKGQFFTPFNLCSLMAELTAPFAPAVAANGYVEVNDPCCGAGATLIAAVTKAKKEGVNYHDHMLFVGQDVDPVVAKMCYIQLSLLGCAGYVIVGNTLSQESTQDHAAAGNIWYMPFYFSRVWHWRRAFQVLGGAPNRPPAETPVRPLVAPKVITPPTYYYYYQNREEQDHAKR